MHVVDDDGERLFEMLEIGGERSAQMRRIRAGLHCTEREASEGGANTAHRVHHRGGECAARLRLEPSGVRLARQGQRGCGRRGDRGARKTCIFRNNIYIFVVLATFGGRSLLKAVY